MEIILTVSYCKTAGLDFLIVEYTLERIKMFKNELKIINIAENKKRF